MKIKLNERFEVSRNSSPYIIAEIGSNHNGNLELCKRIIKSAKRAGANCVKFQSFSEKSIFSKKVYEDNFFIHFRTTHPHLENNHEIHPKVMHRIVSV